MLRSRSIVLLLVLVALLPLRRVSAAEPPVVIDVLYEEAKEDLKEGRFPFALEKFRRGLDLAGNDRQQAWRMLLGIGLAYEKMGQLEHTIEAYRRFLSSYSSRPASPGDVWAQRAKLVEDQVVQMESSMLETRGALVISSQPEGSRVEIDGLAQGAQGTALTPFTAFLAPGPHEVRLQRDTYRPTTVRAVVDLGARRTINVVLEPMQRKGRLNVRTGSADALVFVDRARVGEGSEVSVEVDAGPHVVRVASPGKAAFEQAVTVTPDEPVNVSSETARVDVRPDAGVVTSAPRRPLRPLWGWIGLGGGGAILATGAVFTVLAKLKHDDLVALDAKLEADPALLADQSTYDRYNDLKSAVDRNQIVAGVMYGVGGAAVVGSAVYLIFFADHGKKAAASLPVHFAIDPSGGIAATFTW